ncbi:MAG: polysaccharide deacetylase family protein [Candidatus Aminicenantes bacterium]|nr:polysaccharide deacetylase family protein [Candidatus Aminicenantes bacterium]
MRFPAGPRGGAPRAALLALIGAALACKSGPAPAAGPGAGPATDRGAIVRGDTSARRLALVFTGGSFADGGEHIRGVLRDEGVKAGFFFTGDFYRTPEFAGLIRGLAADGHYLGPHSDRHLLYCDWDDRSKTLVGRDEFRADLEANFAEMARFGVAREPGHLFIPPYEWHNDDIAAWSREMDLLLFNFTPGTSSNADYTTPAMPAYLDSRTIYDRILAYEKTDPHGLNGFLLLVHIGADPERTDKFYLLLGDLVRELKSRGYAFVRVDALVRSPAK